ncbi:MAG: secretin N-terminal domain-containing protein [Planctomycetaceae bacterium]
MTAQDTPEVAEASSINNTKPALAELMARFAEIEAGYLPFHIEYRGTGDVVEGPYKAGAVAESKQRILYTTQRGHQSPNVWMRESTANLGGDAWAERRLWQDSRLYLKGTSRTVSYPSDFDESIETSVPPLEGIFPLLFATKSPIRVSEHFAASPSEFTMEWHEELARVMCHYRPKQKEHIAVELWLDPDYGWHPVFMRRYVFHTGGRFPDEWKALQFIRLAEQVRIALGDFNCPIIRRYDSTDAFSLRFMRIRFEVLKSAYQDRVAAAVFSPDTPVGGSPIAELEPVGGEQVEVKSSSIAELSPPALKPEQILAFAAVTNQQSATEMRPAASMNPTSPALPDEIQSQIAALEAELIVHKAELGERHPTVKKLNDKIAALREVGAELLGQVTVLHLKNARAKDVAEKIEQLFPDKTRNLVVDERTNSLLLRGDEKLIRDLEQIVQILDEDVPVVGEQVNADLNSVPSMKTSGETLPVPATRSPFGGENSEHMSAVEGSLASNPPVPIAEYRRRLADLETPMMQLAEKVRAVETSLGKAHPDAVKQRAQLRALVQKTFAVRQEIQRAELAEFTRRLERMRRSIETRGKIADKIVDRRVEELLSAPSAQTPNSTNSFRRGNTSTTEGKDLSFIPWKVPKNSPLLEISPTAWGESVHGLRAALAVTDGPGELAGIQQLHLVVQNLSNVPIQISDTGWSGGFVLAIHVARSSGEQVETLRPEKKIMFARSISSHLLESGETVVLATAATIGRGIDSDPNDNADLLIADHRPQTTENRTSYLADTSVIVPQDAGLNKNFDFTQERCLWNFQRFPGTSMMLQ